MDRDVTAIEGWKVGFAQAAITLAMLTVGCAGATDSNEEAPSGTEHAAITGGYVSPDTVEANQAVSANGCSGELLAPDIVLTAGHCMSGVSAWEDAPDVGKGNWRAVHEFLPVSVGPDETSPRFNGYARFSNQPGFDDAILLLLDRPVPASVATPRPFMSASKYAAIGSSFGSAWLRAEGYGASVVRHYGYARVTGDAPRGINTITTTMQTGQALDFGDSGGPLLWWDSREARYYVVAELLGFDGGTQTEGYYLATFRQGNAADKPDISAWLTSNAPIAGANRRRFAPAAAGDLWQEQACYTSERCGVGDFNGDGLTDTVAFGSAVYVGKSYGYRTPRSIPRAQPGAGFEVTSWATGFSTSSDEVGVADVDGDGSDDILAFTAAGISVAKGGHLATSFGAKSTFYSGGYCNPSSWRCLTGEVERVVPYGDEDVLAVSRTTGGTQLLKSTGTAFVPDYAFNSSAADGLCAAPAECHLADVDGDHDDDLIVVARDTAGTVRVLLASPTGLGNPVIWTTGACASWISSTCLVGDVDRDLHADLIMVLQSSTYTNVGVWRNLGAPSPALENNWHRNICHLGDICMSGDVNGDGLDDLITFPRSGMVGPGDVRIAASLAHF